MKHPTWKRVRLEFGQHMIALGFMVILAGVLFNSYLSAGSMNGPRTYYLNPLIAPSEFEDSDIFGEIFQTAVADITRLVVIKGQMETDGQFDPHKYIDVTKYASRKGAGNNCPITVFYELDDLIKWGKYGLEYTNRAMSMSDFVNYFGPCVEPENFMLDDNGQLYFVGFLKQPEDEEKKEKKEEQEEQRDEGLLAVAEAMNDYSTEQLEDMVFSYLIARTSEEVSMYREDDGALTVYIRMLSNRYNPIGGDAPLFEYAGNWVEYIQLQQNVAETVVSLTENYRQYQNCNALYEADKSNIKYAVRMLTSDGLRIYTNVPEVEGYDEVGLTDYFSEFRRYMIYYPDSLEFMGNTSLTEEDIYAYMSEYEYAYPETTHLWIGVDTAYSISGDAFHHANSIYQRIVPHIKRVISLLMALAFAWFAISVYLTVTAGVAFEADGERTFYLNRRDHIWTELMVAFGVAGIFGAYLGGHFLTIITKEVFQENLLQAGMSMDMLQRYGCYGAYGFITSLLFAVFWYSLVRRVKSGSLWKDSFVYFLLSRLVKLTRFVFRHKNAVISTLLPYHMFLLANLIALIAGDRLISNQYMMLILLGALLVFDGCVGLFLFKRNAEQVDIVEGINRIREGEVEYKLHTESLHGANREMADAVNNIGEGIRNAVRTSMKDEQMKTDLITNVSHDIKTPLTSIINYVDLLKRLDIQQEPAKTYIDVLDGKAQRLKQLTDDLVEASKISSGNIELNMEKLNLAELLNQTIGEFSQKLEDQGLQVIFQGNTLPANICGDSRRMWRVAENLFNNICKYALEGTRVYVDLTMADGNVEVSVKNISRRQMNIQADELTERFIRGDSARTTEGSGLGLSIAKSLTQVQGGSFRLKLDGDLFKVTLCFPEYREKETAGEEAAAFGDGENTAAP
ncbi:MAG: HAMP domain-containing histidine kinase [Roseburia sp.]|nr:HAMP domain-containing histidine kinase [Roseburia sp.]